MPDWSAKRLDPKGYAQSFALLRDGVRVGGALAWTGRAIAWLGDRDHESVSSVQEHEEKWALDIELKLCLGKIKLISGEPD